MENDNVFLEEFDPELRERLDMQEALSQIRQFSASSIGELIKTLSENIVMLSDADGKKVYFDKDLVVKIKDSLTEVLKGLSESLKPEKVDYTPVLKIVSGIKQQNDGILQAMVNISKPETNDSKYQELLKVTMEMVARSNRFLEQGLTQIATLRKVEVLNETDYSEQLKEISSVIKMQPTEWEFEVVRDGYSRITKVTAKGIIKN